MQAFDCGHTFGCVIMYTIYFHHGVCSAWCVQVVSIAKGGEGLLLNPDWCILASTFILQMKLILVSCSNFY